MGKEKRISEFVLDWVRCGACQALEGEVLGPLNIMSAGIGFLDWSV